MPSDFLRRQHAVLLKQMAEGCTVEYFKFVGSPSDDLTGEFSDSAAYDEDGERLPALITYNPSEATRKKFGFDQTIDVVVRVAAYHESDADINIVEGDAMLLPESETEKYYIVKVAPDMQKGKCFLEKVIALRRGNVDRG